MTNKIFSFKNWNIMFKVMSITVLTIVFILSGVYFYIVPQFHEKAMNEKKEATVNLVECAYSLVESYEKRAAAHEFTTAEAQKRALTDIAAMRYDVTGSNNYFWVNDDSCFVLYHPKADINQSNQFNYKDAKGKYLFQEITNGSKAKGSAFVNYEWPKLNETKPSPKLSFGKYFTPWHWVVASGIFLNDFNAGVNTSTTEVQNRMLGGTIVLMVIIFLLAAFIASIIIRPIRQAVDITNRMANGDLSIDIKFDTEDETGRLLEAMKNMSDNLERIIESVRETADSVAEGSQQLSKASVEISQGATEQASSAEETSSSMEEMASNIQQNYNNSLETEKIAIKTSDDAKMGGEAVSETVEAMRKIAERISIIEEIARQTNLLALNAAIEAARAGEHGKGFAVVASEVRKLAERSQNAAEEIMRMSASSIRVAEKAGDLLNTIVPNIAKTSNLVQEISCASREQTSGAEQVNRAIQQLDHVIQQNAGASETLSATAEELNNQSQQLIEMIGFFKLKSHAARAWDKKKGRGSRHDLEQGRFSAPVGDAKMLGGGEQKPGLVPIGKAGKPAGKIFLSSGEVKNIENKESFGDFTRF